MTPAEKIVPVERLPAVLAAARADKTPIGLCHGAFRTLQLSAVRQFERARREAGILVVAVVPDAEGETFTARSPLSQAARVEMVAALSCVDYVVPAKTAAAADAIQLVRPDVYAPWEDNPAPQPAGALARETEAALVRATGGKVLPAARADARMGPLQTAESSVSAAAEQFLAPFSSRHSYADVTSWLEKVRNLRVLFLGETIIDEYQFCETIGKSGKEPILAARYLSNETFAGGVLSTANQAAAVCDHVGILSLLGTQDSHEAFIREKLDPKIDASFLYMPGSRTILKRRIVEVYPFQKLFEVYFMDPVVPEAASAALLARLSALLPRYDAVVVTDYGHGLMTPEIIDLVCSSGKFLAVNTQTNAANQGFNTVAKYPRADYVCVSEKELRLEARNRTTDVRLLVAATAERMNCKRVMITRGGQGCLCYNPDEGFSTVPPFTDRIVDRIGAGDALLAITAPCAAVGAPMEVVGVIGNAVGAQAVTIVGNRSVVSRSALLAQLETLLSHEPWQATE